MWKFIPHAFWVEWKDRARERKPQTAKGETQEVSKNLIQSFGLKDCSICGPSIAFEYKHRSESARDSFIVVKWSYLNVVKAIRKTRYKYIYSSIGLVLTFDGCTENVRSEFDIEHDFWELLCAWNISTREFWIYALSQSYDDNNNINNTTEGLVTKTKLNLFNANFKRVNDVSYALGIWEFNQQNAKSSKPFTQNSNEISNLICCRSS